MITTCVVCNAVNAGMISIFQHPNNLDFMLNNICGHQVEQDDYLCITCYDELKIAFNFKQKCHQSKYYRPQMVVEENADSLIEENDAEQRIEISSTCGVITEEEKPQISVKNASSYNEQEIEKCIADYFVNDKCDENQDEESINENINIDENKYIIHKIDSDESLGIKEQLDDNDDDDDDPIIFEEQLEQTEAIIKCEICQKEFIKTSNYRRHMRQSHSNQEIRQRIPRDKHRRGPVPKYHENDLFKNLKDTQCEFCYKNIENIEELQEHEDQHKNEERPYRCNNSECSARFKDRYSVRNHISIHTGEKRYKCRYCDKRFHQSGNARAHERYHTGEKPYLCPHCGKGFAENGNLKAHIRHHTGERPYKCPYCNKTFRTHYTHKIHVRSHTQEKPFECSDCGKSFNCTGKLKIHERIHTGVRPFKCNICNAAFMDSSRLKRHSKTHIDLSTLYS